MVQSVIQYPAPLSVEYATDVRVFDEKLFSLIDDLKDTINENNLDGLAAYQIGNFFNVIVVKSDNEFIEIINPRLIGHSGIVTTQEATAYYPNKSAMIERFETISIVYQDRNGQDQTLKAEGELAILLQRKIDYTFGATFIQKMSADEKAKFENSLSSKPFKVDVKAEYCPRIFMRDKILFVANILTLLVALMLVISLFLDKAESLSMLWNAQIYTAFSIVGLDIIYFFYAQYEGKKYISCDSCQLGNIIGTVVISLIRLSAIMGVSYYFVGRV